MFCIPAGQNNLSTRYLSLYDVHLDTFSSRHGQCRVVSRGPFAARVFLTRRATYPLDPPVHAPFAPALLLEWSKGENSNTR